MQEVFVEWQVEIMRAQGIYRNPSFSYPQTPQTPGTPDYFAPMAPAPPYKYGAGTPITPPNPYPGYPSPYEYSPVNGPLVANNLGLPPQMSRDVSQPSSRDRKSRVLGFSLLTRFVS